MPLQFVYPFCCYKKMRISTIAFFALLSPVASISYDCGSRGEAGSEKYWEGNYQKDVLPCEFKEIDIPSDYKKYEPPENPIIPNHQLAVGIERVEFLEDGEKCNVTVTARFNWMDRRLTVVENATNNWRGGLRAPLSAMYYVWRPGPRIYYYDHGVREDIYTLDYPGRGMTEVYLSADTENMTVRFYVHYRKSVIIKSNVGYTYYPHDKHEFILFINQGFEGKLLPRNKHFDPIRFWHPSFKIHVMSRSHEPDFDKDRNHSAYVITFTREPQTYIIRTYLPSGLFVFLSWLSMMVPVELATERVALCTASLLTLTTFFNTASQLGPVVSYLRASDIWLLGCILFVFIILFENIAVMKIAGRFTKILPKRAADNSGLGKAFENIRQLQLPLIGGGAAGDIAGTLSEPKETIEVKPVVAGNGSEEVSVVMEGDNSGEKFVAARRVDRVTNFIVTAAIIICNVVYWIWLLVSAQTSCEKDSNCSDEL